MADNVTANPGTGGAVFATDDIGGVQYPRTKITFGPDGSATDVSGSAPLPVTLGLTNTELRAAAVPVTGGLTDTQLRATAVPVSGPLTDAQLRATSLTTTALTDTQLRATAVPISDAATTLLAAALGTVASVPPATMFTTGGLNTSGVLVKLRLSDTGQNQIGASRTGGFATTSTIWPANTTPLTARSTDGQFIGVTAFNSAASVRWLKVFDSTSVTVGTTTPKLRIPIPPGAFSAIMLPLGVQFVTAIVYTITTGQADTDNTAPGAGEVVLNVLYT